MKTFDLKGTVRQEVGKKSTRDLRRAGRVPCNLYGVKRGEDGLPVALAFSVANDALRNLIYTPHIYAVRLDIDGEVCMAVMREQQFHPVKDNILHIDFYQITDDKPIEMEVPVALTGLAEGVRAGGKLQMQVRKLRVKATYDKIPEKLEIDVTNLGLGKSIKVCDLSFDGLELTNVKETIVCSVKVTRAAKSAAPASAS